MIRKGRPLKKVCIKIKNRTEKIPRFQLYSPREKLQNCIWKFTIGDADDKPSVPHAHAKEKGYRLDAWTGDVYPPGNERIRTIGKLKSKELSKLHKDPGFIDFAKKQIEWYREENPQISFYVPEWFELKNRQVRLGMMKQPKTVNKFVFIGKVSIHV